MLGRCDLSGVCCTNVLNVSDTRRLNSWQPTHAHLSLTEGGLVPALSFLFIPPPQVIHAVSH